MIERRHNRDLTTPCPDVSPDLLTALFILPVSACIAVVLWACAHLVMWLFGVQA